jgi:hypothetical protein
MGGGKQPTQTTVTNTTSEPAAWQKPLLEQLGTDTLAAYNRDDFNVQPFSGNTVVPYATETLQGMDQLRGLASGGAPNIDLANSQVGNILQTGGISGQQQDQIGNMARVAQGGYRPEQALGIAGMMQTASGANLDGNPYLDDMFQRGATQIGRSVNDSMGSAGRYGSGAHQSTLGQSVGDLYNNMYSSNYAQERANQMAAQGQLVGAGQGQDQLAMGAANNAFNALNTGTSNIFQAAGMSPSLFTAQGLPSEFAFDVGQMQEDLAARNMQQDISRYNAQQMAPYDELMRLNALASGAVSTGASSTGTTLAPSSRPSTAAGILGGAATGAAIGSKFPVIGTGLGAIGGGILGGFF